MLRKTWFGGVFKPKNLHSLEHLRYLYSVLSKNQVVSDSNRGLLVETLRSIAEILIWGDQNDSSVFDFFLEKQMLAFFLRIMKQKCGSYVCVQLLQTLNILFENIRNETSLYYLLSNNHVNYIIEHKFDFSDEEVMAYYISFLKTLSFKLNSHTIHFFYNEHTNDFPLYTEAIKFFNHPESMVRIAVRTLTLNVYRVNDRSMLQFIRDRTAVPYFSNLVWFIGNHILELDACVRDDIDHDSRDRLSGLVAEHLDHLHYLNDILRLHITPLNHLLAHHLLHRLLLPLLVNSLLPPDSPMHRFTGHRQEPADVHSDSATEEDSVTVVRRGRAPRVSKVVALFLLAQVFLILSFPPLINTLARYLMHAGTSLLLHYNKSSSPPVTGFVAPKESLEKSLLSHGVSSPYRTRAGSAAMAGEEQLCERAEVATPTPPAERDPTLGAGGSEADLTAELQSSLNITDEEKQQMLTYQLPPCCLDVRLRASDEEESLDSRPFLQSVVEALSCTDSDYTALFALCLLYALGHNAGFSNSGCPVTSSSDEPSKNNTSAPQDDHSSTKAEPLSSRSSSPVELQTEFSSHPETSDVSSPMLKSTNSPNADGVVLRDNDNLRTLLDVRETSLSRLGVGAPCGGEDDRTSTCSREDIPGKSSSSDYHSGAESCYCPTDASDGSEVCQAAAHKGTTLVASEKLRQQPCMAEPSTDRSEPRETSSGDPGRPPACSSDNHQLLKACDDVRRSSFVESALVEEGSKRRSSEAKHHSVKPYNSLLVEKMLQVISLSTQYNSKVRVVTLEIAIQVLKQVVGLTSTGNCNTEASPLCNGETASDAPASESLSSSPSKCSKSDDAPVPVPASVVFSASCSCPEATGEGPCVSCSALPRASVASGEAPTAGGAAAGSEGVQCAAVDVSGSAGEAGNQQSQDLSSASVACATDEARGRLPRSRGPNKVVLYDEHLAVLEGAKEEATLVLRNYYKSEEMFLDLFEDEWSHSGCGKSEARRPVSESLRVEYLLQDSNILLPPTATPLTGIQLNKRRPCGEVERARRAMRVFFLVRSACLAVRGEQDTQLPLTRPSACVRVDDVLDLNNSDLIACVVITRDGERCRRFLVIDVLQLILVEPDQRRLGWGVAKFVGFLQYLEVNGDKDDSRVLHLTIHHPASAAAASTAASSMRASSRTAPPAPLLSAKFIFDDHIRCMAAKQRLCKGRNKARQRKLHQIARLLELPSHLLPCPSPPSHPLSAMRLEAHHHHRRGLGGHRSTDGRSGSRSGRTGRVPGRAAHQTHGGGLGGAAEGGGGRVAAAGSSASELARAALGEEIQLEDISGQSLSASQGGHPYLRRL